MSKKIQLTSRYIFSLIVIIAGIILSRKVNEEFLGFDNVGSWLIYVGFIMLVIITLQLISNKKRIVDERMHSLSYKSSRITFLFIIIAAFIIMIIDGINPIHIPYHIFMSYIITYLMLIYFISYKILEKHF